MSDFNITVNGQTVPVIKGQTVLQASLAAGIDIPAFCWHPQLVPVGACRICLVEIEKFPKLQVACATVANEGMIVHTNSPKVIKARQGVLEFILAHHPLDCPTCDKGGECDLQDITFKYGLDYSRQKEPKHRFVVDPNSTFDDLQIGPEIVRNQNRCIHCYRCVRIVNEILFEDDLGAYQRGHHTEILPPPNREIRNLYSGNIAQYCPVGALTNRDWRYKVRVWNTKQSEVICPHCSDGCNLKLWTFQDKVYRVTARTNEYIDNGFICDIGRYGYQFTSSTDRLKQPMIRKEGELVEVSWKEALDFIKTQTDDLKSKLSGSGFFGFIGADSSNEVIYAFQRLLRRIIGTNNIDHRFRRKRKLSLGSEVTDRGIGLIDCEYSDIENADLILVLGSDLHSENPISALRVKKAIRRHGATLILANPRPTPLGVRTAEHELLYKPGTEVVLLSGLIDAMLDVEGIDPAALNLDSKEVEAFRQTHSEYNRQQAASICGIEVSIIEQVARRLVKAANVMILTGREVSTHPYRDALYLAIANLQRFCKSAKFVHFPMESNTKGAEIFGGQPDILPGYVSIDEKTRYEDLWKGPISEMVGKDTIGILNAIDEDEIECGFIFNVNPLRIYPDGNYAKSALEKLKFLVVIDTFLTDTARIADCILPLATFVEGDGTRVNWEGRMQYSAKTLKPFHQSKTGCEIIEMLADKLGVSFGQADSRDVYKEITGLLSDSTPKMFTQFTQAGSLIRRKQKEYSCKLAEIKYTPLPEDEQYPYKLLVGNADHHRGALTEKSDSLLKFTDDPYISISISAAEKLGVGNGELIKAESKFGKLIGKAKIEQGFPDDVVFVPENFTEMQPNQLMERHEKADLIKLTRM